MERRALTSSRAYFVEVLTPNRDAYVDGPVTFAGALNFATSLFHFHEWLFADHRDRLITSFGLLPNKDGKITAGAFWAKVQGADKRFGYIRDVANASKHMVLTNSSTGVKNIGQTSLQSVGFGVGAFGVGRYSGPNFMIFDQGETVSFDECASRMFDYWGRLLEDLSYTVQLMNSGMAARGSW